jgi:hypothetical protein
MTTKIEELKAAWEAARAVAQAVAYAAEDAWSDSDAAYSAYCEELKKQEENSDD